MKTVTFKVGMLIKNKRTGDKRRIRKISKEGMIKWSQVSGDAKGECLRQTLLHWCNGAQ